MSPPPPPDVDGPVEVHRKSARRTQYSHDDSADWWKRLVAGKSCKVLLGASDDDGTSYRIRGQNNDELLMFEIDLCTVTEHLLRERRNWHEIRTSCGRRVVLRLEDDDEHDSTTIDHFCNTLEKILNNSNLSDTATDDKELHSETSDAVDDEKNHDDNDTDDDDYEQIRHNHLGPIIVDESKRRVRDGSYIILQRHSEVSLFEDNYVAPIVLKRRRANQIPSPKNDVQQLCVSAPALTNVVDDDRRSDDENWNCSQCAI